MPPPPPELDRRRALWVLLGITAAAAAVRFAFLGRPCLWGDEALVYWRTCGTFAQLLRLLHGDGFPPLHYELYWLIVHASGTVPSPAAMRAVPAACGTLLVPAVYGLARQLLPRRPSLWAAAFTAGSGFALFYSRDAKMYAEAWLAMTVSVACLLAWVRTGRATAWLAWVAAGSAAAGLVDADAGRRGRAVAAGAADPTPGPLAANAAVAGGGGADRGRAGRVLRPVQHLADDGPGARRPGQRPGVGGGLQLAAGRGRSWRGS